MIMYDNRKKIGIVEKVENRKLCIGIIILLNCLVNVFCFTYNYLQDGDEFSSIAFPVYLAGGDWSEVVTNITGWHGYGHVIIYAPFFKFCKSWAQMYNICRIGSLFTWILLAVFIFYMASTFFDLKNSQSLLVALVCTLGNLKPDYGIGLSVESELPMGMLAITCMFLLISADSATGFKKKFCSFVLFFLMIYSLTIHSRGIVLILTSIAIIFLISILRKHLVVSPVFSLMGSGTGFCVYKFLNEYYIQGVLTSSVGMQGSLVNSISNVQAAGLSKFLNMFFSLENIQLVFQIFLSLLSGFSILSFGIVSLFVVVDIQCIVGCIKNKKKDTSGLVIGILVGLISFFMMNGFIAINQYKEVIAGDKRWFLYLRYAMPYAIMIVFTGLVVILKKNCNIKRALSISTIINVFLFLFFLEYPLQELKDTAIMNRLSNIFRQYFYNGENADIYFYKMILYVSFVWFLFVFFIRRNKQLAVWGGYILISLVFTASTLIWHYRRAQEVYAYTDASEKIIRIIESENDALSNLDIYCNSKKVAFPRYLRTNCPWSEIHYISVENINLIDLENSMVFTDNSKLNEIISDIYKMQLDNNEFLYTRNRDVYNWLSNDYTQE